MKIACGEIVIKGFMKDEYVTKRNEKEHLFKAHNGYAISRYILEEIKREMILRIRIIEEGINGQTKEYLSNTEDWLKKGYRYNNNGDYQMIIAREQMVER